MNTELISGDAIRAALDRIAERAPDPDGVRGGLPARTTAVRAQDRRRMLTIAVAAAAVVALLAVPTVVLRRNASPASPFPGAGHRTSPAPTPSDGTGRTHGTDAPLEYSPTWLPPGFHEQSRRLTPGVEDPLSDVAGPAIIRTWVKDTGLPLIRLSITPQDPRTSSDSPVRVGRHPGGYWSGATAATLKWQLSADRWARLEAVNTALDRATLFRVAGSVGPTPGRLTVPLRIDRPPADAPMASISVEAYQASSSWRLYAVCRGRVGVPGASGPAGSPSAAEPVTTGSDGALAEGGFLRTVQIEVDSAAIRPLPEDGESLTVAGHPARYSTVMSQGRLTGMSLAVRLPGVRILQIEVDDSWSVPSNTPHLTREDLIVIAESVTVGTPDLSWASGG